MSGDARKPLKVLQTVQSYFPFEDRGGPVVKVRALARGLAQRGHSVTVLTADLGFSKHDGQNGFKTKVEHCRWGWRAEEDGVEAIYLSTIGHYRALTVNPNVIGFCSSNLEQFDLVHFYGLYDLLGPAVGYFCRRQGIPYVIEPMGMYRPIDRSFRLKRLWHQNLGGSFWKKAAQIVATSEMEQGELVDDGVPPEKIVIRYNGIEGNLRETLPAQGSFRAKWKISPDEPLILFLGRLIPRKGAGTLIEAFAQACPESGRLVIAGPEGEPGYLALLQKCAQESGVSERVLFTGALYGEQKRAVLADASIFALPSRYENFANSVAEAIACGVPVIISDSCGIRSLVSDRAGLVISSSKDALAQALHRLISDKALYARLKAGCEAVADELSWSKLTEKMEGYYSEALARRNDIH
jgi:glycosyltransferase involved in cell wall biosynthesis